MAEFQAHWLEHHSQFGPRIKSIRRYVQYHVLPDDPIREAMAQAGVSKVEPYDGVAIAWFDNLKTLREGVAKDPVAAEALADEKYFVDQSRTSAFVAEEHVVVEPIGKGNYVLLEILKRRSDIDRQKFSDLWKHHAHIGLRAHEMGLLMGYIQNHTLLGEDGALPGLGDGKEPFDGVVTAYFDSVAKFKALVMSPLASQESYEDEKKFIDHTQSVDMLTRRHVIKDLIR